jgi:agmatine deiminase
MTATTPAAAGFRMPAEWELHGATWLAWPHEPSDWPGKFDAVPWVFAEVARHLQGGERVRLIVRSENERAEAGAAFADAGVDLERVDFFVLSTDRSWTRDFLPLFVVDDSNSRRVAAVKWLFNGWSRYPNYDRDEAAGARVPELLNLPSWAATAADGARVVLEGGAIDVDGEGTLLATEQCLLTGPQARNRELGRAGTERALYDYLGVRKVLWLAEGIAGDDTSGHIDDFARFVAPGRVLLCEEANPADPNYRPLNEARERLETATDAAGRRIEIVRLAMPAPLSFAGQRLPASYANFYIGNGVVLVPTFNDPYDRYALGLLSELFPERTIVGIHCLDLVLGLGTLHCSTQQEPAAAAAP